jgi:hypothetical protein
MFPAAESLPPVRCSFVCRNPACGLRRVSLPQNLFGNPTSILCDRCLLPMECASVTAGLDPYHGEVVWSDVTPDPAQRSPIPI